MRIYKANLDENYDVISYDLPSLSEKIFSNKEGKSIEVLGESIQVI